MTETLLQREARIRKVNYLRDDVRLPRLYERWAFKSDPQAVFEVVNIKPATIKGRCVCCAATNSWPLRAFVAIAAPLAEEEPQP